MLGINGSRKIISLLVLLSVTACAEVSVPDARNVKIPTPVSAEERQEAINERPDSVMYLPLGADVLVPERISGGSLPNDNVGPFELRSETLAGALQLILADYDVSIAFETDQGLTRQVTVANLKGDLNKVVNRVCSLADLYCSFEEGALVVKNTQTFAVTLPPLADAEGGDEFIGDVIQGLSAILGGSGTTPVSDSTTRTIIYSATQRTSQLAENYFQRLRANTAMIVFETYIWEVSLDSGNSTGINWDKIKEFGKFNASIDFSGAVAADFTNPVSIGLPTTQALGANPAQMVEFLSQFGAVKTISQPQITVLSGSKAELRVADTENYVSEVTSTVSGDNTTTSVSTDSVDSGFTLTVDSSWDKSTVYANVNVNLTNVDDILDFAFDTDGGGGQTTIQLPQTTERELTTQIRVRPGDSVLIAGLVREVDNFNSRGAGFMEPIFPDSRTAKTDNLELVILLRPRVIVYTAADDARYERVITQAEPEVISPKITSDLFMKSDAVADEIEMSLPVDVAEIPPSAPRDEAVIEVTSAVEVEVEAESVPELNVPVEVVDVVWNIEKEAVKSGGSIAEVQSLPISEVDEISKKIEMPAMPIKQGKLDGVVLDKEVKDNLQSIQNLEKVIETSSVESDVISLPMPNLKPDNKEVAMKDNKVNGDFDVSKAERVAVDKKPVVPAEAKKETESAEALSAVISEIKGDNDSVVGEIKNEFGLE